MEAVELGAIGFLASSYGEEALEDSAAAAEYVQSNSVAMVAFHQQGERQGKGEGRDKSGRCPARPSTLSVEDRRKRLE